MKKALLLILSLSFALSLWGTPEILLAQETARKKIAQAEAYVSEGEIDFAFMEYRAFLKEYPKDPLAERAIFAIGEYYFRQRSTREAKEAFERLSTASLEEIPRLLTTVYLLQCARTSEDTVTVQALEFHLKEILSSRKLFLAFEENRVQEWISPLGNRFELREFVDRLEIVLNDAPFYTIRLP